MRKKLFLFTVVFCLPLSLQLWAQRKWVVDPAHSKIGFSVIHLVISEVEGSFNSYSGTMITSKEDYTNADIQFTVDVSSVDTDNEMRDNHLKGNDFFNAEKFPEMIFKSTSFKKVNGNNYSLEGDLTIRDVTRKVKFNVVYGGTVKDPYGNTKAGFKANASINRFDYNLKWNALTEAGGAVVSPEVEIDLRLEFALKN